MTDNEFMARLAEAGRSRLAGDVRMAGEIYAEMDAFLRLGGYQNRLRRKRVTKVFGGVRAESVLRYLFDRVSWCMDACETKRACTYIHYYKSIEHDFSLRGPLDFEMSLNEIETRRRLGDDKRALELCEELLRGQLPHARRARVLIAKGGIETGDNVSYFRINSLSEALGEAEASGDQQLIAHCYHELGTMCGIHYVALGLSFMWKALIIYEKSGDKVNVAYVKLSMAMSYFLLHQKSGELRFIEEAERLVNDDIVREDLPHPAARYGFDRVKGVINRDLALIEGSVEFFESIHAENEVLRAAESYIKIAIELGRRDLAKQMVKRYEASAQRLKDIESLDFIRSVDFETCVPGWVDPYVSQDEYNLLDVLERISYDEEWFHLDKSELRYAFPTHYQEGLFETVQMSDGRVRLYPCGLTPNRYYRGQSDRLEGKKCQPSLYRGLSDEEIFHERLCLAELDNLLDSYPLTQIFARGGFRYKTPDGEIRPLYLAVDSDALGQHYGIKTDLLDITVDKWVAAFFASTTYRDGKYEPVKDDGIGVMYIYEHFALDEASDRVSAVGLQPFSRPGRQAGLVYRMEPGEDFNDKAHKMFFRHDPAISELVFNYCNRSKRLFPDEILEDKVKLIKSRKIHSAVALYKTLNWFYPDTPGEVIDGYLANLEITIQTLPPVEFTPREYQDFSSYWHTNRSEIFENVTIRQGYVES